MNKRIKKKLEKRINEGFDWLYEYLMSVKEEQELEQALLEAQDPSKWIVVESSKSIIIDLQEDDIPANREKYPD